MTRSHSSYTCASMYRGHHVPLTAPIPEPKHPSALWESGKVSLQTIHSRQLSLPTSTASILAVTGIRIRRARCNLLHQYKILRGIGRVDAERMLLTKLGVIVCGEGFAYLNSNEKEFHHSDGCYSFKSQKKESHWNDQGKIDRRLTYKGVEG